MDIFVWFLQKNASALVVQESVNSILLLTYLLLSIFTKKPSYMLAFFMSCMLFEMNLFDNLSDASLYLLTFTIYSYVIFDIECNRKAVIACGTIMLLSVVLAYDSYHYGIGGIYGAHETIVYQYIEYLALYAHAFFIGTLIPYIRIGNCFRRYVDSIMLHARDSVNFVVL